MHWERVTREALFVFTPMGARTFQLQSFDAGDAFSSFGPFSYRPRFRRRRLLRDRERVKGGNKINQPSKGQRKNERGTDGQMNTEGKGRKKKEGRGIRKEKRQGKQQIS